MSWAKPQAIWGIHAGQYGEAETLFLEHNVVALGWPAVGNLNALSPDREAYKTAVSAAYPGRKAGAIPVDAGQLFRFVQEVKVGDLVAYPCKRDRNIHIGRVIGNYEFSDSVNPEYPNRRKVEWLKSVPRTKFSQGALYEIGSAITLFQIKNYVDEYHAALEGKSAPIPVEQDETVAQVAVDIEDTTHDYVLKRLSQELKGLPLEGFIVHLLQCMGYQARLTRKNEPSVDIIAHKDRLGIEPPIIKVQVKSGDGVVADRDVSALFGKLAQGEYGLFITLSTFSPSCHTFAQSKSNLRLIDGDDLVELIFQNYEQFDARHKGLLPLKRIYVPAPVIEE